jgi:hypothetical protein
LAQEQLPTLYRQLMKVSESAPPAIQYFDNGKCSAPAVMACYVFFESAKPLYVGISKNLRVRLPQHLSEDPTRANLALRMAAQTLNCSVASAKNTPGFVDAFRAARERLFQATVAHVEVGDSMTLYLLEPFVAMKLDTQQFNRFDTLQILRPSPPSTTGVSPRKLSANTASV